ncbi:MAG: hypothetical protein ACLQLG_04630 [Thermoguttaceae bacterium]
MTVHPGAILASFRLLGWLFPAPPLEELTSESFESLRQKYKSRDRWGNFLGLLAFIAVAAIYYLFISWLAQAATRRFADAKFLHHPMELEYILMGLFLSLASTGFFGCLALRAFLGREEYAIYMAYGARRAQRQIHAGKVFLWFFLVLFPALGVLCVLRATMFTAFTEKAVFDSSFGSLGVPTEHLYTDVRDIYFARKYHARFEDRDLPRHVIVFKDGSQWRTDGESGGAKLQKEVATVRYVSRQSGRPVIPVQFIEDIPR